MDLACLRTFLFDIYNSPFISHLVLSLNVPPPILFCVSFLSPLTIATEERYFLHSATLGNCWRVRLCTSLSMSPFCLSFYLDASLPRVSVCPWVNIDLMFNFQR